MFSAAKDNISCHQFFETKILILNQGAIVLFYHWPQNNLFTPIRSTIACASTCTAMQNCTQFVYQAGSKENFCHLEIGDQSPDSTSNPIQVPIQLYEKIEGKQNYIYFLIFIFCKLLTPYTKYESNFWVEKKIFLCWPSKESIFFTRDLPGSKLPC